MMTLGVKVNDTIEIDGEKYLVNETRSGEQDILRLPIQAKKYLDVDTGNVIQNSRLKEIFDGSVITHSFGDENTTIKEKYSITSKDKNASVFEVKVDNTSVASSSGIFKDNSTYTIAVNGKYITSFNYEDGLNKTFKSDGHEVEILFKDTNSTSIKVFALENQGYFLNFNFD